MMTEKWRFIYFPWRLENITWHVTEVTMPATGYYIVNNRSDAKILTLHNQYFASEI